MISIKLKFVAIHMSYEYEEKVNYKQANKSKNRVDYKKESCGHFSSEYIQEHIHWKSSSEMFPAVSFLTKGSWDQREQPAQVGREPTNVKKGAHRSERKVACPRPNPRQLCTES